jgi:hypothetical protein
VVIISITGMRPRRGPLRDKAAEIHLAATQEPRRSASG